LRKFKFLFVVLALMALLAFVMSKAREWSRLRQRTMEKLTRHRNTGEVPAECPLRRRKQICNHIGCEPRRRRYGLERTA
jgi:hypothetical protein